MKHLRPSPTGITRTTSSPVFFHHLSCGVHKSIREARFSSFRGRPLPDTEEVIAHLSAAAAGVASGAAAGGTRGEVDLHGLTAQEAVMVVVGLWDSGLGRRSTRGGSLLLITGVGHHSGLAGARLRPAVRLLLEEMGVAFEEQKGAFLVACSGPRRGPLRVSAPAPALREAAAAGAAVASEPAPRGARDNRDAVAVLRKRLAYFGGDSRSDGGNRSSGCGTGCSRTVDKGSGGGDVGGGGGLGWCRLAVTVALVLAFVGVLAWVASHSRSG